MARRWYDQNYKEDDITLYDNLFFEEQKDSPRKVLITNVAMEGTDITVIFTADNVWRTNIFLTKEKPAGNLTYTKLVGQTEKTCTLSIFLKREATI